MRSELVEVQQLRQLQQQCTELQQHQQLNLGLYQLQDGREGLGSSSSNSGGSLFGLFDPIPPPLPSVLHPLVDGLRNLRLPYTHPAQGRFPELRITAPEFGDSIIRVTGVNTPTILQLVTVALGIIIHGLDEQRVPLPVRCGFCDVGFTPDEAFCLDPEHVHFIGADEKGRQVCSGWDRGLVHIRCNIQVASERATGISAGSGQCKAPAWPTSLVGR